jgi:hypothetical protein
MFSMAGREGAQSFKTPVHGGSIKIPGITDVKAKMEEIKEPATTANKARPSLSKR